MTHNSGRELHGRAFSDGDAAGPAIVLTETLSLWGGVDPITGAIVDRHHPQLGTDLAGAVVVLPGGRGSCGGSAVLLECLRRRTSAAAWLLLEPNQILVIGAVIAEELYGIHLPIAMLDVHSAATICNGDHVRVTASGTSAVVTVRSHG